MVLRSAADCALALERLGLPLIVKPATQGSSVGMSKVSAAGEMDAAYRAAAAVDDVVFAEQWITGAEYTVAVLHRRVLPSIRIEAANAFYDYEAKYHRNDTKYHCPAGLSAPAEAHMASLALAAFDAVGAEGWGRVDFMADATGRPLLLETQHRAGHDRPQPGADGRARRGHRLRRTVLAGARDQLRARAGGRSGR